VTIVVSRSASNHGQNLVTIGKRTVSEGTVDLQARRGREQISTSVRDAPERAQAILQEGA